MKPNDIRNMSPEERGQKLVEMQEAFFNLGKPAKAPTGQA